jgi:hypothetical protein
MKSARLMAVTAIAGALAALLAGAVPASASARPLSPPAGRSALTPARPAGLAAAAPARLRAAFPADTFSCYNQQSLVSNANADYVSAELGYTGASYGMLRARATTIGPWEKFDFCYDATQGWWAISSDANGLYVTAQFGYAGASFGELTASSSSIGPYQKWLLSCIPGSPVGPQIEFVTIRAQTNLNYVSAEIGYTGASYGMLRARAATAGPWEEYFNPSEDLCA